jgi:hypothetical protein
MAYERTGYAPWSLTREAGVESATVDGTIKIPQYCQPTLDTGFVDEKGNWQGRKSSDRGFLDIQTDLAIADNGEIFSNKVIDMYGYSRFNMAIQVSRAGNYYFELSFFADTDDTYLNLKPIATNRRPKATIRTDSSTNTFTTLLSDQEDIDLANVWYVYQINDVGDFRLGLKVTNQSGGNSNIQTAIQRLV